jgi:cholesterol transport system auxiliary component
MIMRAFLVSVVVGMLAGCGSVQGPAVRYYKLDIPPVPTPAGPSVPVPLRIEPFQTTGLLRQDRIVYRPSPEEVGFYEYHRWAERPNDTVTKALADQLTGRRLFQSVEISDGAEKAEYVLRGTIDRLQEVDYHGAVRAQVSISVELEDPVRREKIWASVASSEFVVKKSDVQAVVTAMGQASQQSIERLVAEVVTFVKANRLGAVSSAGTPSR